ncbi:MAG: NAD(+)/NADH kinase [Synergistaceae bacterium]|jgi:NAD+ kinase|nr:NAD(+)/NADH kinase [Synergistaceae bacterium]
MDSRTVGLFFKKDKKLSADIADRVMRADYGDQAVEFVVGEDSGGDRYLPPANGDGLFQKLEFALSIGGDGTFLRTARTLKALGAPLYGINAGRLGFLASGKQEDAALDVMRILSGDYSLQSRASIHCKLQRSDGTSETIFAMNEIVISKGSLSHPIDLRVLVGGETLYRFLADGIIISTPTGSTAYALSAGGPVVHPDVRCILLVPICPHSLYPRPIVMAGSESIEIRLAGESEKMYLSGDGLVNMRLGQGDKVMAMLDESGINMIKLGRSSYYETLQKKLGWGVLTQNQNGGDPGDD